VLEPNIDTFSDKLFKVKQN